MHVSCGCIQVIVENLVSINMFSGSGSAMKAKLKTFYKQISKITDHKMAANVNIM